MTTVLVFGCIGQPGHCWHGIASGWRGPLGCPWRLSTLDGGLAPRRPTIKFGSPGAERSEGVARLHHNAGWTALSFWDRSGDHRGGSNTTFVVEAHVDFDAMLALASEQWPELFRRFTFAITQEEVA